MKITSYYTILVSIAISACTIAILSPPVLSEPTAVTSAAKKVPSLADKAKLTPSTESSTEKSEISEKDGSAATTKQPGIWPCFDELDMRLVKISIPMIINFSITPLVGANDLFWTNRMGNALAVAGMAAANQVYNTGYFLASFLPSVTSTLVSKENAKKNDEGVQDAVCQAMFVAIVIATIGTALYQYYPEQTLKTVLEKDAGALQYAKPYLAIRSFGFLPALISLVGFSAFRGTLDVKTPFTISFFGNMINCMLDPLMIFTFKMGVPGNAMSTLLSEVVSAAAFVVLLQKKQLIKFSKIFKFPKWSTLAPLIRGGLGLQLRMLAFNITFMAVARVTQSIDKASGVAAAAHEIALQTFQLGGVVLLALSVVAQIMIPSELYKTDGTGGPKVARITNNRMMSWGLVLGTLFGGLQILVLPLIQKGMTPMKDVRDAAYAPAILASVLQIINGLVFIGEGVMSGCGDFMYLAGSTSIATLGCLVALGFFPKKYGVAGVWMGFAVFNILRLLGVAIHQYYISALAPRNINKADATTPAFVKEPGIKVKTEE